MRSATPSLRHNFLWTLSGNLVYATCLWGMLVVLTKLGSPGVVGRFSLAAAVATPVFMFANLQLRAVLVAVYGLELGAAFLEVAVDGRETSIQVTGFVSPPALHRANRSYITLFVNFYNIKTPVTYCICNYI